MVRNVVKNLHSLIEEEVKKSSMEELFLQDLTYSIETNVKSRLMSKYYKPSSLSCIRCMYYYRTEVEILQQRQQYNRIGEAESGTDRHLRIQKYIVELCKNNPDKYQWVNISEYIKENNIEFLKVKEVDEYETKLFHTVLELSFQCDGILKIKVNGIWKYFILEIKTENSLNFSKRVGINDYHKPQVSAYSVALNINDVLFLYENRNTLEKKIYPFLVTEELQQDLVVNKINICENYISQQKVPPMCDNKKGCVFCKYIRKCSEDGF